MIKVKRKRKSKKLVGKQAERKRETLIFEEFEFVCPHCRRFFTAPEQVPFITVYSMDKLHKTTPSRYCPQCWTKLTCGRFDEEAT